MQRSEESQQVVKKPSLLSGSDDAVTANSRILAGLEQDDKGFFAPKKPISRRSAVTNLIVGLLTILGVGAAIIVYQNNAASPVQRTPLQADSPHTDLIAKKTDSIPVISVPAPEAEPEGLAALIVNEPVAIAKNLSGAGVPGIAARSANPSLAVNSQETGRGPDISSKLPQAGLNSIQKNSASSPKSITGTHTQAHAAATVPAARHPDSSNKSSPAISTEKQGAVATKGQTADRDVALLEALVAHATEQPVRAPESPKKSAKNNQQPVSTTIAKTREHNRDFVERKPNDSTESLLQRCKQLGFFEGEFCRWRMCSGRWDSDAACKVAQEGQ
ncbi:MAG: hypothetical protein M3A44_09195 [Gammaproteobacteria bacterium]